MSLKIGIVGTGSFAQGFIPLFKAHPLVGQVVLCDLDPEKLAQNAAKHQLDATSPSLDALCAADIDSVCLFTQNWLHGPQAVQALAAGKHVYSAVPAGIDVTEIEALVATAAKSGKIYMIGETSYYYPGVIYCRQQHAKGLVYGEAEYYHDWDHCLYDVARWRGGDPTATPARTSFWSTISSKPAQAATCRPTTPGMRPATCSPVSLPTSRRYKTARCSPSPI